MSEEEKMQIPSTFKKLKQFELFYISTFLTFPELALFFQIAPRFATVKSVIKEEVESNLRRLKKVPDQNLLYTMRRALEMNGLSSSELRYAQILKQNTLRFIQSGQIKGFMRTKRIFKEIELAYKKLQDSLVACWLAQPFKTVRFMLRGNPESVYRQGYFVVEVKLPIDYPFKCFCMTFLTPIYHPTVNTEGRLCNCAYQDSWSPKKTMADYLCELLEAMKDPAKGLQNYACVLRAKMQEETEKNFARFQKKAILNTRQNAKFSLTTLLLKLDQQ